jgi:hypothetical protein
MTHPPAVEAWSDALGGWYVSSNLYAIFVAAKYTPPFEHSGLRTEKKLSILRTAVTEVFYVLF